MPTTDITVVGPSQDISELSLPPVSPPHIVRIPSPEKQARLLRHFETVIRREAKRDDRPELHDPDYVAAVILRAAKLLGRIPDPWCSADLQPGSSGEMQLWNGKAVQKNSTVEGRFWASLEGRFSWCKTNSGLGPKHLGLCDYDAYFVVSGYPRMWNVLADYCLTVDLDTVEDDDGNIVAMALETAGDEAAADALAVELGCHYRHTTASHDPAGSGKRARKYRFPCAGMSYLDRPHYGLWIRRQFAAALGISEGTPRWKAIDAISERGAQLEHLVRWKTQALKDQAYWAMHLGKCIDLSEPEAEILAAEAAEEARLKAKEEARAAFRAAHQRKSGDTPVAVNVSADARVQKVAELLQRHGPRGPATDGQAHTFRAIILCKKYGLSEDEAWPLLRDWNLGCEPQWSEHELRDKLRRGYVAARVETGSALRTFASASVLEAINGIAELDLGADEDTEQTTSPGSVTTFGVNNEDQQFGDSSEAAPTTCPPSAKRARLLDRWWGGICNPTELTQLHTAAIPALTWGDLRHKLTVIDSPCGTQKSRAYEQLVRDQIAAGRRVVVPVPSQSLSIDLARRLGIQSHMDPLCDWTGSLVCCIHSLHKVKLFSALEETGFQDLSLDDENPAPIIIQHPLHLLIWDEFGEQNDCRTDSLIREARRCDSIHKAAQDLCAAAERILGCQAHVEVEDLECVIFDWLRWGGKNAANADWELLSNDFHILKPDIFIGASKNRVRREMMKAWRKGHRLIVPCSTVMDSELEALVFAVAAMSERAGFDVAPFCGEGLRDALEPVDQLPDLVRELAQRGFTLDQVRPRVLRVNSRRHDDDVQALLADPNAEVERWDAIFHTATIQSGFSIYKPMAVFAFLRAGAGPVYTGIHQMVLRCRLPIGNEINACIEGHVKQRSGDPEWWYRHLTRLNTETESLMAGFSYRLERADDGSVYLVDFDEELVRAEAKRLARYHRRAAIEDVRDDMGRVIEPGALTAFWQKCGFQVIYMYEMELLESLTQTVEEEQAEKKVEAERKLMIRKGGDEKTAAAPIRPKSETDKMKKERRRTPDQHHIIESADIRHKYGLVNLTADDVEWHRKHGRKCSLFALSAAVRRDRKKVTQNQAEWEGPMKVHHRHRAAHGAQINRWMDALGLADLEAAAVSGLEIPSFGAYLASRPAEREIAEQDFGITWTPVDATGSRLTVALLRAQGLKTLRRQKRLPDGRRVWVRTLDAQSVALMREKSRPAVKRYLDPEQAREEWEAIEGKTLLNGCSMVDVHVLIAGIIADVGPFPPLPRAA